jgi:pimeloyl-ACP methyl ester carboxylesterase
MARSFEQIYAPAPKAAVGRLLAFRERCPSSYSEYGGRLYRTWDLNQGADGVPMVFLPSGLAHGEMWFPYMLELARYGRCIAFSYAEDEEPKALAQAYLEILSGMGVDRFVLIAQSVGGLVAQVIAAQAPQRVAGLLLALSGCPGEALSAAQSQHWINRRKMARRLRWSRFSSGERLGLADNMFEALCPEEYQEAQTFWMGYIEEVFDAYMYKAQYAAINSALVPAIYEQFEFTAKDFQSISQVCIFESQGDKTFGEQERAVLRGVFPQAQVHDVGPHGQFTLMLHEGVCLPMVEKFIAQVNQSLADHPA